MRQTQPGVREEWNERSKEHHVLQWEEVGEHGTPANTATLTPGHQPTPLQANRNQTSATQRRIFLSVGAGCICIAYFATRFFMGLKVQ